MAPPHHNAGQLQNPFEEQQSLILQRICGNVDKLNEAVLELTKSLGEVNAHNEQTALVTEMWSNYMRNVRFNLEAQGTLQQPQ